MDILTALQDMLNFYTSAQLQVQALLQIIEIYGYNPVTKTITTSTKNYDVVRFYALVLLGSVSGNLTLTSKTQAENLVKNLNDIYEAEFEYVTDTNIFAYLAELQSETINVISENTYALPDLISYTSKTTQPVSNISQILYQDNTREDEIIQMNNSSVKNPLFMPLTIEVLSK